MNQSVILITGSNGQLGKALTAQYPDAHLTDAKTLNIADRAQLKSYDWSSIKIILNTAAYTNVDGAETTDGRIAAWQTNALALRNLVEIGLKHNITIVHISTDYVFDGSKQSHSETEPFSPLGVYGQTKAAGDIVLSLLPKHYIIRTSWVIGDGPNFVRTMLDLGKRGVSPTVVNDQMGRLTFTSELVRGIDHLLTNNVPYGTYNLTNEGDIASWAEITRDIFKIAGFNQAVNETSTAEYFSSKDNVAPRPLHSKLDMTKLSMTGFKPSDWRNELQDYVRKELSL